MTTLTRSQAKAADVAALLRARNPVLWIVTREEARIERYLYEAAASAGYVTRFWDISAGATDLGGKEVASMSGLQDPGAMIAAIASSASGDRSVWVMRDLPVWLQGPPGAVPLRALRNLAKTLPTRAKATAQAVIILSTSGDVPPDLADHVTVLEWPMPDREEIAAILDAAIAALPDEIRAGAAPNGTRDAAIDAAIGLSGSEASACYARSLVQLRKIDPATVAAEKKRVITRERILEWYDPLPGGLNAVGGLERLKDWLTSRSAAYSPAARAYGLPAPKGTFLVGVPGCGKSLLAKAIATAWGVPLLRLDLGALKSKFVGESEGNLRRALRVIEALGRCVVWIDEIEKALAGATQGAADGGVSSDALGTILSWMQERTTEAFVVATANDVTSLPPELLRKGRWDEMWFVDLPNPTERLQVLLASLRTYGRKSDAIDLSEVYRVTEATAGFTGSEIAAIVPDALYAGFADGGREITVADLVAAAKTVTPLAKTASTKIEALRAWAVGRARPATAPETTTVVGDPLTGQPVRLDL